MVHQELNQVRERNVMDNLWLGRYPKKGLFIDEKKMLRYARRRNAAEKMIVYMETFRDDCKGKL